VAGESNVETAPEHALQHALSFMRACLAKVADSVRPIEAGIVLSTPSLPAVWAVNQLRVACAMPFEALLELAEEQLAGFEYRQIAVEDQLAGPGLEASFRAASWKIERDLVMVLGVGADRPAETTIVEESGEEEMLELIQRWYMEDDSPPSEVGQLVDYARRETHVLDDRALGVRSRDGQLVAVAKLRSAGATAQVDDVYTTPEARGRGYARALITHAVDLARASGSELIFIVADDQDWPKRLYERLGFRAAGRLWQFHRD
jgi:GNAT superfamily N-acetyltransferase